MSSNSTLLPESLMTPAIVSAPNGIGGHQKLSSQPLYRDSSKQWQDIGEKKRAERDGRLWLQNFTFPEGLEEDTLPDPSSDYLKKLDLKRLDISRDPVGVLSDFEKTIVHSDASGIVEMTTRKGGDRVKAVDVLQAFCKVAIVAQRLTNCLTEIFFEEGMQRAEELDKYFAEHGKPFGPLHGVPVSIKDHIKVKGHDTSSGYIDWVWKKKADKDAVVVDILRKAGAIIYVKTANPQSLLSLETENNIYGRTVNPFNRKLSPGGSSGGEGALISCHGSPMGVGTDIGGSIRRFFRVPAAWCGLYGFKASVARMPHAGLEGSHDGMDNIIGVVGPLATSARDLELFCSVMLQYQAWRLEHAALEIPWKPRESLNLPKQLCFAILKDDGVVTPHPPILDALALTRKALEAEGHVVVDWDPVDHQYAWDLIVKLYLLDGGEEYRETLAASGEPATKSFQWMLDFAKGRKPYTVAETWRLNLEREKFRAKILEHWNKGFTDKDGNHFEIDAIICPIAPTLAPPHDSIRWWGYSSYWNLVDYPAAVFPVGQFNAQSYRACGDDHSHPSRNDVEKSSNGVEVFPNGVADSRNDAEESSNDVEEPMTPRAYVAQQWKAETYNNAPIALQIVGRRHNEEKVLALLNVVEMALKNYNLKH